ncbi:MAG TPA: class IV adenylate cyclase [Candidatus Methanomethylicus sp.]|nr:class IV adenylate cyclase [Candidatus Methanomethylicus sp.]HRU81914.1 class IV adenylate cyclase [Candidatus Methanomethylicus sp.]
MQESCEVEVKARVPSAAEAEGMVLRAGGSFVREGLQEDVYLRHPCRDLKARDEALRLRREGGACVIAFKGRREGGAAKMREEVEVKADGFDETLAIFERLGFAPAYVIAKRRREFRLGAATVVVDSVEGLGNFIEVEVKAGGGAGAFDAAKKELFSVTDRLGIRREMLITDSYLELLASRSSDSSAER